MRLTTSLQRAEAKMSTSYSGEKIINRQRICGKCKSYVTHDKVSDGEIACALCGYRAHTSPTFSQPISVQEVARLVASQLKKLRQKQQQNQEKSLEASAD